MFDEAIVEMSTGTLVRLPELSARLAVGERGPVRRALFIDAAYTHLAVEYLAPAHVWHANFDELLLGERASKCSRHGHRSQADRSCHCLARNKSIGVLTSSTLLGCLTSLIRGSSTLRKPHSGLVPNVSGTDRT